MRSLRVGLLIMTLTVATLVGPIPWAGAAGPPAPPRTPFDVGFAQMVGDPMQVDPGTWVYFHLGWGWASDPELTDPHNYLEEMLTGGYTFELLVDGNPLAYDTEIIEIPNHCSPNSDGDIECHDATLLFWTYLQHPLSVGEHTVTFRLTFLKEFPDDGWGFSVPEWFGFVLETTNTLTVMRG